MFLLEDGRQYLFQWDTNRRLIVEDPTITEVHFCNRTDDCSLVVETYLADKLYADIPNVLLQNRWDIRAFAYCGTGYTKVEEVFEVKPRSKPADYVYTETEVKRYEDLEKHLDERLDEIAKEGIKPDLEGYATEEYVDNAIEAIEIPEVDLTGYATEGYVDEAIKGIELPDDCRLVYIDTLATSQEVQAIIDAGNWPVVRDMRAQTGGLGTAWMYIPYSSDDNGYHHFETLHQNYAWHAQLNKTTNELEFTAIRQVGGGGGNVDLSAYAKKTDIPTKVSQLSNDAGYLKKHQDISHLATIGQVQQVEAKIPSTEGLAPITYVDNKVAGLNIDSYAKRADLVNYAKKADIPDHSQFLTSIPSEYITQDELYGKHYATEKYVDEAISEAASPDLSGFATEEYVDDAIAQAALGADIDLSAYAKKTDIPDVSDFISEIPSEYVTETELENKGYATEKYVDDAIAGIEIPEVEPTDLSNYYTKTEVDGLIPDVSDFISEIPSEYITETELNAKGYLSTTQAMGLFYTQMEVDNKIDLKIANAFNNIGNAEGGAY